MFKGIKEDLDYFEKWFVPLIVLISSLFSLLTLTDSYLFYFCIGLASLLLLWYYGRKKINKEVASSYLIFVLPLVVYAFIIGISRFSVSKLGLGNRILVPIGLLLFATIGYLSAFTNALHVKFYVLLIYCVIGFIVLVNLVLTLVYFGPFHSFLYSGYSAYYDGKIVPDSMSGVAYCIINCQRRLCSIEYYSLFPSLLITCGIPMMMIPRKPNPMGVNIFVGYVCLFILGLSSLILTCSKKTLITDVFVLATIAIVYCLIKYPSFRGKPFKIILISTASIAGVIFLILFLNAQSGLTGLRDFISSNKVLNYLFNTNTYASRYKNILSDCFSSSKLFGFGTYFVSRDPDVICYPSGNWFIDQFMYGGIFALVVFVSFIVLSFKGLGKYLKYSNDSREFKGSILALCSVILVYSLINGGTMKILGEVTIEPFFMSSSFILLLVLLGYSNGRINNLEKRYE